MSVAVLIAISIGGLIFVAALLWFINKPANKSTKDDATNEDVGTSSGTGAQKLAPASGDSAQLKNGKPKTSKIRKDGKHSFQDEWLLTTLKGHGADVLDIDFSPNGKYIISCSSDRSCYLWSMKELNQKEHKFIKSNVEFDHATHIKFSPDSKAFVVSLANGNNLRVFRFGKKDDGTFGKADAAGDFEEKSKQDIINIGISSIGKFIMTCHSDTSVIIYDLKGEVLATIDTGHMYNHFGAVSPCGRFVATSGFTPDVKIWEVIFEKATGSFKEVRRAFELKGHNSGIYSFAFNSASSRVATVSKDGTWKLWIVDIDYVRGQDPVLLKTGSYKHLGPGLITLSPDSRVVAIAQGTSVSLFDTESTEMMRKFDNVHSEPITAMGFDWKNRYLVTTGDRQIHVIHNVLGYRAAIRELEDKLRTAGTKAAKERFIQSIAEARESLKSIGIAEN